MLLLDGDGSVVYTLAFCPVTDLLLGGTKGGSLIAWDAAGGEIRREFGSPVISLACHPQKALLAVGMEDGRLHTVSPVETDLGKGPALHTEITTLAFLDPLTLAVGTGSRVKPNSGMMELWSLSTETLQAKKPAFTESSGVRAIACHPASQTIAWATGHKKICVLEHRRQDPITFGQTHTSPALCYHPDGQTIAAAVDYSIVLYDPVKRQIRRTLAGHKGRVMALAFSPDGRSLASASWDGTVRLWEWTTGARQEVWNWEIGKLFSLAYDSEGHRLAVGGDRGNVMVWDLG